MSASSREGVKRALRAYVLGRDSGSSTEAKSRLAEASLRQEQREPSATESVRVGEEDAPTASIGSPPIGRTGVPVPSRLDFHRSASRWRDFIPGFKSGGA